MRHGARRDWCSGICEERLQPVRSSGMSYSWSVSEVEIRGQRHVSAWITVPDPFLSCVYREKIGYVVCCQQSMNRFGNRRFHLHAKDFMKDDVLHDVVNGMHSELLALTSNSRRKFQGRCLVRVFKPRVDSAASKQNVELEISGAMLRHQPAVSLLISRIRPASTTSGTDRMGDKE